MTLVAIQTKLTAKGYQLTNDPEQANYWIQAKVVYCHKAAEGVTPESVAKARFGAGVSSGGTAMVSVNSMGGDETGRMIPGGMPNMNAMMAQVMAMSGWGEEVFPGCRCNRLQKKRASPISA